VRDLLLGRQPKDLDYVVVGATVDEFLAAYPTAKQVGQSFPVFQVVEGDVTKEYAFARIERKVGLGHQGFEVIADPTVTLKQDLGRRDLTINAMALPLDKPHSLEHNVIRNQVIDPYGGVNDLDAGILRHTSEAFREDPLRVFRLARFKAQLSFKVAPETRDLVQTIPKEELYSLSAERVAEEARKAMRSPRPRLFFEEILNLLVMDVWFPQLLALVGVPAGPPKHHEELDSFEHTMMVLDKVTEYTKILDEAPELIEMLRWAALTHDLGKGITPREQWPHHYGHEQTGIPLVHRFYDRLKMPAQFRDAAVMVCAEHMRVHIMLNMRPEKWVDLVRHADRTKIRAEGLSLVALGDAMGREAMEKRVEGPIALQRIANPVREATGHPIPEHLKGERIGQYIRKAKAIAAKRALDPKVMCPERSKLS
jgi:tRNA nucleotidyltransferase (CCA-adding enzyme)